MERGPAGQVRTEQVAQESKVNSLFLPATSRVTWGSAGAMRIDQVGSGARRHLAPSSSEQESHWRDYPETGADQGCCSGITHSSMLRTIPLPVSLLQAKGTGFNPGGSLAICWIFSPLQGLLYVADESEQTKGAFSLLASYPYWPPLISLSCYRPWRPPLSRLMIGFGPRLKR